MALISPEMIANAIVTGLLTGTLFAPLVVSFNLIYRSTRVINFFHGDLLALGAYVSYTAIVITSYASPILGILLSLVAASVVGLLIDRGIFKYLINKPVNTALLVTIGLSPVIQGSIELIWGTQPIAITKRLFPLDVAEVGPLIIPYILIYSALISLALLGVLLYLYYHTRIGIKIRAVSSDPVAASTLGISISRIYMITWIIASITAFISGIILSNYYALVSLILTTIIIKVIAASLLGGLDSILGGIVGSMVVGLVGSVGNLVQPPGFTGFDNALIIIVALLFMLLMPYGLFGTRRIERV